MDDVDQKAAQSPAEGLRWLSGLRWWALAGAMASVVLSLALNWSFVKTPAIVAGLLLMLVINGVFLWRSRGEHVVGRNELLLHAGVDLALLTWMLAWAGGARNPISVAYSFHVVIGALLVGRRGAVFSTAASLGCMGLLWAMEETGLLPSPPVLRPPGLLWLLALGMLVIGVGYLALVIAERQNTERARAKAGQEQAEGSLSLLFDVLGALRVGVDAVDKQGRSLLTNDTARALRVLSASKQAAARADQRLAGTQPGDGTRVAEYFTVRNGSDDKDGRIIELVALQPGHARVARADLYVDRTESLLVERRHLMLERLATLGRAMQGVAHELNTPLTTMQTLAKDLRAALQAVELTPSVRADVEESLQLLIEEARRCRSLTQGLLSTANDGSRVRGNLSLTEVARRAVRLVGVSVDGDDVWIDSAALATAPPVDDRVLQILMNLVQNALAATNTLRGDGGGPRVRIEGSAVGDSFEVRIRDRGPGLPTAVQERLFEPFVTTKKEGTGLGLYTSQQVAADLGGTLTVKDDVGGGTVAALRLPLSEATRNARKAP